VNIVILGSKGMLGSAVTRYFEKNSIDFFTFDNRFNLENPYYYVEALNRMQPDFIINCIGSIPQTNKDLSHYFICNSVLPAFLSCHADGFIVQPSTDCVFNADDRKLSNFPDSLSPFSAQDPYGLSKAIADLALSKSAECLLVRTSLIGLTYDYSSGGLLDWLVKNKNGSVDGFDNHLWNGITTDAWINWVYKQVILSPMENIKSGIVHLGSTDSVSKFQILKMLNDIMGLNIKINKEKHQDFTDRRLKVDYEINNVQTLIKNTVEFWS
jgi:dTDP-4-dehydrorhamnose reductase